MAKTSGKIIDDGNGTTCIRAALPCHGPPVVADDKLSPTLRATMSTMRSTIGVARSVAGQVADIDQRLDGLIDMGSFPGPCGREGPAEDVISAISMATLSSSSSARRAPDNFDKNVAICRTEV